MKKSQLQEYSQESMTVWVAISDWCPDGKWLLTVARDGIWRVPVASASGVEAAAKKIASNPAYQLYQAHMSSDGRWIVFGALANSPNPESSLFVVPASGGPWTRITDGKHWDDKPRWSPDGKIIYYVSRPGGFFNVWGIHFDPAAGKAGRATVSGVQIRQPAFNDSTVDRTGGAFADPAQTCADRGAGIRQHLGAGQRRPIAHARVSSGIISISDLAGGFGPNRRSSLCLRSRLHC